MQPSLSKRVQSGVAWNSVSVAGTYLCGLIRSIVVARLLVPEDFGLIGMAMTVVTGMIAVTAIGLEMSVIKTHFDSDEELKIHLNTVWTVDLIRRTVLGSLLALLAYPAARFYHEERLYPILLLFSLLPLLYGLQNIGLVIYRKQVSFRRIVWFELTLNLVSVVTSIVLVVLTRNVWALVLSLLITAIVGAVLSYFVHPFRPRLALQRKALNVVLSFGKYAVLIAVLGYIMQMADNVLLGRMYHAAILGAYVIAYNLAVLPIFAIGNIIVNVTFPAYTEIASSESSRLESAFLRVFAAGVTLLALITTLLLLLPAEIIAVLCGPKWSAAASTLRILSLLVFCRGCAALVSPLLVSIRGLAPDARIKLLEAAIFLGLLFPLTIRFGAAGAAWAGGLAYFVSMINRLYFVTKLLPNISKKIVQITTYGMLISMLAAATGVLVIGNLESLLPRIITGSLVAIIVVGGMMVVLSADLRAELMRLVSTAKAVQSLSTPQLRNE